MNTKNTMSEWLSAIDFAWLCRFSEFCKDFEADGYDVPKDAMKRLACLGVVRWCGGSRYETTAFGDFVVEQAFEQNPSLPLSESKTPA